MCFVLSINIKTCPSRERESSKCQEAFVKYKVEFFFQQRRDLCPFRGEMYQVGQKEVFMSIVWVLEAIFYIYIIPIIASGLHPVFGMGS